MSEEESQEGVGQSTVEPTFEIKKIFVKDLSFESPNTPTIFIDGDWQPEMNVLINGTSNVMGNSEYEVILTITVTVKQKDKTAFLIELQQAGVFVINGYQEEALKNLLGAFCLETLFPFAREAISSSVRNGGFPQLLISPVNFSAVYQQKLEAEAAKASQTAAE